MFIVWKRAKGQEMFRLIGNIKFNKGRVMTNIFYFLRQVKCVLRRLLPKLWSCWPLGLEGPLVSVLHANSLDGRLGAPLRSPDDMIYWQSFWGCWATSRCGPLPL